MYRQWVSVSQGEAQIGHESLSNTTSTGVNFQQLTSCSCKSLCYFSVWIKLGSDHIWKNVLIHFLAKLQPLSDLHQKFCSSLLPFISWYLYHHFPFIILTVLLPQCKCISDLFIVYLCFILSYFRIMNFSFYCWNIALICHLSCPVTLIVFVHIKYIFSSKCTTDLKLIIFFYIFFFVFIFSSL